MRRCLGFVFAILFLSGFIPSAQKNAQAISASSYCVIDGVSGRVLYEKEANKKRGMASTTKIMTAIVVLENAEPDSVATVSYKASCTEGSSLYLKAGEKMKVIEINATYGYTSTGNIVKDIETTLNNNGHECAVAYQSALVKPKNGFKVGNFFDRKWHALWTRIYGAQGYASRCATKKLIKWIRKQKY